MYNAERPKAVMRPIILLKKSLCKAKNMIIANWKVFVAIPITVLA